MSHHEQVERREKIMKYCIHCRHKSNHKCYHKAAMGRVDAVTGNIERKTCEDMRRDLDYCGPDASLFEPSRIPWFWICVILILAVLSVIKMKGF